MNVKAERRVFLVLLTAIDGRQEAGNQSGKCLDNQAVIPSGNQMSDLEMAFPPCKESIHVRSELVNKSDLFWCQGLLIYALSYSLVSTNSS